MLINKLLIGLLTIFAVTSYALVPIETTTDPNALSAAAVAAKQASTYMQQINQAQSVAQQIKGLQGLQQLQSAGTGLCNLCNQTDQQQLTNYLNAINGDLCSQFSNAMSNMSASKTGFDNIQSIIGALSDVNPQAASLSLAQSSATTYSTLAQMQMMQAQAVQKQMAEEKIAKSHFQQSAVTNPGL